MNCLFRQIIRAVLIADKLASFAKRGLADAGRVGAHVSDQTDRAFRADLNSFVKVLRNHHGALYGKAKFARSFLLQLRSNERRNRVALSFFGSDFADRECLSACFRDQLCRLCFVAD